MSSSAAGAFEKNVYQYCVREGLFSGGDKIIIGVSGGPDSVGLVHWFSTLGKKYDLTVRLVHVNYHLRGDDAQRDEQFVRLLAAQLKLDLEVVHFHSEVGDKQNMEQRLRDFRYEVFEQIRQQKKFNWVAVAHTLNDQAETVLMHLIRGSGLRGLGGMRPKRDRIIRPFLGTDRNKILHFLRQRQARYRIDKTNRNTILLRNRIRKQLLPLLEARYSPNIQRRLSTLAKTVQKDHDYVHQASMRVYQRASRIIDQTIEFDRAKLLRLHPAILRRVFRMAVMQLTGTFRELTEAHWDEFEKLVVSEKSKLSKCTFGKVQINRRGNAIRFGLK